MSQRSKVSGITFWGCFLNTFWHSHVLCISHCLYVGLDHVLSNQVYQRLQVSFCSCVNPPEEGLLLSLLLVATDLTRAKIFELLWVAKKKGKVLRVGFCTFWETAAEYGRLPVLLRKTLTPNCMASTHSQLFNLYFYSHQRTIRKSQLCMPTLNFGVNF